MSEINGPKKRGRKAKTSTNKSVAPKKRGRKPKGGKIIENSKIATPQPEIKPNVICTLNVVYPIYQRAIYTQTPTIYKHIHLIVLRKIQNSVIYTIEMNVL